MNSQLKYTVFDFFNILTIAFDYLINSYLEFIVFDYLIINRLVNNNNNRLFNN